MHSLSIPSRPCLSSPVSPDPPYPRSHDIVPICLRLRCRACMHLLSCEKHAVGPLAGHGRVHNTTTTPKSVRLQFQTQARHCCGLSGFLIPLPLCSPGRLLTYFLTHSLLVLCLVSLSLPVSLSLCATTIWLLQRTNKPSLVQPSLFSLLSLTLPPPLSRSRSLSSSHVLPPRLSYCLSFVPAQDNHSSTASWACLFRF
ncbi:hypothetical protein LY78DRAFT_93115 [Colletotrichum sublineola]|nr:hypothetical protein LY78DRAFT_93115 [Colletotrichum sublineola]